MGLADAVLGFLERQRHHVGDAAVVRARGHGQRIAAGEMEDGPQDSDNEFERCYVVVMDQDFVRRLELGLWVRPGAGEVELDSVALEKVG